MKKLLLLAAAGLAAKTALDRRKRGSEATAALWREAVAEPPAR